MGEKSSDPTLVALKKAARAATVRAMRLGVLVRPAACEKCGKESDPNRPSSWAGGLHAHHPDYSKPLVVKWLCHSCHRREHSRKGRTALVEQLRIQTEAFNKEQG